MLECDSLRRWTSPRFSGYACVNPPLPFPPGGTVLAPHSRIAEDALRRHHSPRPLARRRSRRIRPDALIVRAPQGGGIRGLTPRSHDVARAREGVHSALPLRVAAATRDVRPEARRAARD